MNSQLSVPHGEETINVQLTVKQAMALGGYRFNQDRSVSAQARNQVRKSLDKLLLPESDKIPYHELNL